MSDTSPAKTEASIAEKQQRLETIITQLEDGELSLDRAKALHDEGTALLADLKQELDLGNGEITERT
jgi:exodeoxyribonuclease VII small subunit